MGTKGFFMDRDLKEPHGYENIHIRRWILKSRARIKLFCLTMLLIVSHKKLLPFLSPATAKPQKRRESHFHAAAGCEICTASFLFVHLATPRPDST